MMIPRYVIVYGSSIAEALAKGAQTLQVPLQNTSFEVLERPQATFYGQRQSGAYKLRVTVSDIPLELGSALPLVESSADTASFPEGSSHPFHNRQQAVNRPSPEAPAEPNSSGGSASSRTDLSDEAEDSFAALFAWAASDAKEPEEPLQHPLLPSPPPFRASVSVSIAEGGLKAYLVLHPSSEGHLPSKEAIRKALLDANVIFGVNETAIEEALNSGITDQPILVAVGVPPQPGADAFVEHLVEPESDPVIEGETDRIDYRNVQIFTKVSKGQPLARKIPATDGTPGTSVTGDVLPCSYGKDLNLASYLGRNVLLSEDKTEIRAAMDGSVVVYGHSIHVDILYRVSGDVNFAVGNIDYPGTVDIRGSVLTGFSVKATGDILVGEHVEVALLEAGGNISIRGGVNGKHIAILRSGGDITARFLNQCKVEAQGNVIVKEGIMHCNIMAAGKVLAELGHGVILGGTTLARDGVKARNLGSPAGVATHIKVGKDYRLLKRQEQLREQILLNSVTLQKIDRVLTSYQIRPGITKTLSEEQRRALKELAAQRQRLKEQNDAIEQELQAITDELAQDRETLVSVRETLYG